MSKVEIGIIVFAMSLLITVLCHCFNAYIKTITSKIDRITETMGTHLKIMDLIFEKTQLMDKQIYLNSFKKLVKDDFTKVTKISDNGFEAVLAYTKTDHGEKVVYGEYLLKRIKFDNETYQYVGEKYDKQKI